jgi:hypothetical protein
MDCANSEYAPNDSEYIPNGETFYYRGKTLIEGFYLEHIPNQVLM